MSRLLKIVLFALLGLAGAAALSVPAEGAGLRGMRLVRFEIYFNGDQVLWSSRGDSGEADTATVWRYLKGLDLRPPDRTDSLGGRRILDIGHDPDQPLRATLRGDILIVCHATDKEARVRRLVLVRPDEESRWRVAAEEVERTLEVSRKARRAPRPLIAPFVSFDDGALLLEKDGRRQRMMIPDGIQVTFLGRGSPGKSAAPQAFDKVAQGQRVEVRFNYTGKVEQVFVYPRRSPAK
jgi:hypothetical protein